MAGIWAPIFVPHRLDGPVLDCLLPAQTGIALLDLADQPAPSLYELAAERRLRYQPDRLGVREEWLAPRHIIARGAADCKSLACWRAAELQRAGEPASPVYVRQGKVFHVFVRRGDGSFEDPSTLLGMPFPASWVWPGR